MRECHQHALFLAAIPRPEVLDFIAGLAFAAHDESLEPLEESELPRPGKPRVFPGGRRRRERRRDDGERARRVLAARLLRPIAGADALRGGVESIAGAALVSRVRIEEGACVSLSHCSPLISH